MLTVGVSRGLGGFGGAGVGFLAGFGALPEGFEDFGERAGAAEAVGGIFGQIAHQSAVGSGQCVVGHGGEDVVQRVVAQTDGGPKFAADGVLGVIHGVDHLFDEGHFGAIAHPTVGAEGAEVVDQNDEDASEVDLYEELGWDAARDEAHGVEHANGDEPDPNEAAEFL